MIINLVNLSTIKYLFYSVNYEIFILLNQVQYVPVLTCILLIEFD